MKTILIFITVMSGFTMPMSGQYKDNTTKLDSIPARSLLWAPFDESTMGVQAACGIGFAAAGIAVGYATLPKGGDPSGVGTGLAVLLGGTLGSIGLPLGTYFGGKWMGGNGGWWATLGGCVAGGILGLVPNIFVKYEDSGVTAIVFGVAAVAGGIAAYNLSASPIYEVNRAGASSLWSNPNVKREIGALVPGTYRQNVRITIVSIRF